MRKLQIILVVMLLACSCSFAFAQPGSTIFCTGITDKWEPENPGTEFTNNIISCLFVSPSKFAALQVVLSIYEDKDIGQTLLHREEFKINPDWNNLIIQDIPLPAVGKYTFSLASTDGKAFASGQVTIKEKTVDAPIPEVNTISGNSVADAFNKFINQAK